jgi:hypothetical protein
MPSNGGLSAPKIVNLVKDFSEDVEDDNEMLGSFIQ